MSSSMMEVSGSDDDGRMVEQKGWRMASELRWRMEE
jgi:hypothetical protein